MGITIRKATSKDSETVTEIFNYYSENSFASFFEEKLDEGFYTMLADIAYNGAFYIAEDDNKNSIGFAVLKRFHKAQAYNRTAELTYFLHHDHTNKGVGTMMLEKMEADAKKMGIDTLLAKISSLNPQSIRFHEKNEFVECGRFLRTARKFGKDIDLVWMQKFI